MWTERLNGRLRLMHKSIYRCSIGEKWRQNVRLSRTQEWTKELERSQLKDQVSKELNNAWVNVIEISKKLEIVYSSLDIAKDNLTLNTFSYNEGKLPIIDVLSAQVSWLQAYTNVVSVNYQYKVALAEYAKALGERTVESVRNNGADTGRR